MVDIVTGVLAETGLPPTALVLEITETALIEEPLAARRLEEFRRLGIRVALDDFGTGYSSLGYLRRFPIDVLKIDRSFVAGVGTGDESEALVRAILALGEALHLVVVAEGVEAPAQADRLQALGCALAQGFHFARPLAPAAPDRARRGRGRRRAVRTGHRAPYGKLRRDVVRVAGRPRREPRP